jgi:hypothetical protein
MQQYKRMNQKPRQRKEGQALIELALTITFIALLLAAVVDLGLAFKTQQMLINATAEATSYLSQQPLVNCGTTCTVDEMKSGASSVALRNFRQEVGDNIKGGVAELLDLNADGKDDVTQNGWSEASFRSGNWFRIDPADSSQFNPSNPSAFKISTFTPSTYQACIDRQRTYSSGQCYIVVRAQITYRPFFALSRAMGSEIMIRTYAIKPIVGGSRILP